MFNIDNNTPPPNNKGILKKIRETMLLMKTGDSFEFENEYISNVRSVQCNLNYAGFKFTTKRVSKTHYRVWRIA